MNPYLQRHRHKLIKIHYWILSSILILAGPVARADDYLDALRNEARDLEYLDESRPGNAVTDTTKAIRPEIRKAMQNITHFEEYYRRHDSAGAVVYFRLDTQARLRIYHRFKSTGNFDVARKMTVELFNNKK